MMVKRNIKMVSDFFDIQIFKKQKRFTLVKSSLTLYIKWLKYGFDESVNEDI